MEVSEDFMLLTNLQNIRFHRPWIDCEFVIYQKLIRNREALLDAQLKQIKLATRELRASKDRATK